MAVLALDHVNIRTADPERTIGFFRDVLLMEASPPPGATSIEHGAWILDGAGKPVVHIAPADSVFPSDAMMPFTPTRGSGAIHHVALNCSDYADMRARLEAMEFAFYENHVPQIDLRQIFVTEGTDILLELNFRED